MVVDFNKGRQGYTLVELMVTIVIVTVLAATVGTFIVKLLTIQENHREEAYFRETLTDICGIYADFLSVGSVISNGTAGFVAKYRSETGGVSLETGRVVHVSQLMSVNTNMVVNNANVRTLDLSVLSFEAGMPTPGLSSNLRGDASLIPRIGNQVVCHITPLNAQRMEDATLGYLTVVAQYDIKDADGNLVSTNVAAERVVRLWNRE